MCALMLLIIALVFFALSPRRPAMELLPLTSGACAAGGAAVPVGCGPEEPLGAVHVVPGLLTPEECRRIIEMAEELPWMTARHASYPTTDIATSTAPHIERQLLDCNVSLIERAASIFHLDTDEIWLRDQFVVKYEPSGQDRLSAHRDASLLSYIITLNEEFEGGGTSFVDETGGPQLPRQRAGDAILFCGKRMHEGRPVTAGTRYITTGFLDVHARPATYDRLERENPRTVWELIGAQNWTREAAPVPTRPYLRANTRRLLDPLALSRGDMSSLLQPGAAAARWPQATVASVVSAARKVVEAHGTAVGEAQMHTLFHHYLTHYPECTETYCHMSS